MPRRTAKRRRRRRYINSRAGARVCGTRSHTPQTGREKVVFGAAGRPSRRRRCAATSSPCRRRRRARELTVRAARHPCTHDDALLRVLCDGFYVDDDFCFCLPLGAPRARQKQRLALAATLVEFRAMCCGERRGAGPCARRERWERKRRRPMPLETRRRRAQSAAEIAYNTTATGPLVTGTHFSRCSCRFSGRFS